MFALIGTIIRNGIVLVMQIRDNEQAGMARFDAIVEATILTLIFLPALCATGYRIDAPPLAPPDGGAKILATDTH